MNDAEAPLSRPQVTLACLKLLARSKLSARRKWGVLFMFPTRWLILFLSFFIGVFSPILSVFCEITGWGEVRDQPRRHLRQPR